MSKIKVLNRFGGSLVARTSTGKRLHWATPGVELLLTEEEILDVFNQSGGPSLFTHKLMIQDEDIVVELGINHEPEYFFSLQNIEALIKEGTLEQLEESLEYNGSGFRDTVKDIALATGLSDLTKIQAISRATGANLTAIIANSVDLEVEEEKVLGKRKNVFTPKGKANKDVESDVEKPKAPARETFQAPKDFQSSIETQDAVEPEDKPVKEVKKGMIITPGKK